MAKKDNYKFILMTNCNVKLNCDGEILKLKYIKNEKYPFGVWYENDKCTDCLVLDLIKKLEEKYKNIKVIYKRRF